MRQKEEISSARYFWLGFLVPTVLVLIGFIIIGVWPSGDGTVLIIDSLHQYLPFYTDFHNKLVQHDSLLYSFHAGLGYNFWATYAYYLASPFNFLLAFVPTAHVCDFMDLSILLKLGLCGGTFSWYLAKRDSRSGLFPVTFGTMYALSFFMIGYYFNLMWLDSIAMLPLVMKGIEHICGLRGNRHRGGRQDGRLYGITLFYALWCNYYIGFMICVFAVLYFAVCLVIAGRVKIRCFIGALGRFAVYSALAGGMGALVLLPAYNALTSSESMQSNHFPSVIKFYDSFVDLMLAHFAGIKPINISNTQVGLNAYCGVIIFTLVILFVLDSRIRMRERIARFALASFLLLSFSLNVLNYIWHGFHQQNGLPNRFAFIYIAVILVMSFDALHDLMKVSLWRVLVSGIIPPAFALTAFVLKLGKDHEDQAYPDAVYLITLILMCVYFALLLAVRLASLKRLAVSWLIGSVCIFEAGASAVYGIVSNDSVTRSIYIDDQTSYQNLIKATGDTSWFRSEVDAQRMRNVTLFCGGNSVVMFNSTMQESVTNFCSRIGMEARTNKNGYNGVTKLMNDVLGIKYVLSANGKGSTLYQFQKQTGDGNLTLYKNEDALAIGFMVKPEILNWDLTEGTPIDVQERFVSLATGLGPIYTLDRYVTLKSGTVNGIRIPEGKQVYVYLPSRVDSLDLTTPEYRKNYQTFTDHLYVVDSCDGSYDASFTAMLNGVTEQNAIVYTCPDALEKQVVAKLAEHQLQDVKAYGNRLSGKVDTSEEGVLLLTIPYDKNWVCSADGKKVSAQAVGGSLMGLKLSAGEHVISLTYVPGGLRMGAVLSGICTLLYLAAAWFEARRKKNTENPEKMRSLDSGMTEKIRQIAGDDAVLENEPMSAHTTFRIGGEADLFVTPFSEESLTELVGFCRRMRLPFLLIGNGSNLLVSDEGYRGVVIQAGRNLNQIEVHGTDIYAQAGAMLSSIAQAALKHSLTGMEPESGIPGTLGGALFMNAGAYGSEMKDITSTVRVLTQDGEIKSLRNDMMKFGYRTSIVQKEGMIVLGAELSLQEGERDRILDLMKEFREKRTAKQPLDLPSAGSTFKRPDGSYAGALIEEAGLRGYSVGGAQVSEKHCGFVVNTGNATAEDVRKLISEIQSKVYEKSGVKLEPEVRMIGF